MSEQMIKSYACFEAGKDLVEHYYEPLPLGENDVHIKITACGCCHSDLHTVKGEWGQQQWPIVPGHEIIGKVTSKGASVTKFSIGERVGVGVVVHSCLTCENCVNGDEVYCEEKAFTYGENIGLYVTKGGYAEEIRVHQHFVFRIPEKLKSEEAAPLLCAGITTFSPLHHYGIKKGDKVGIMGVGGLGHLAIQFAAALGAEVTAISSSNSKEEMAKTLGATKFINSSDSKAISRSKNYFDFILSTVSADIKVNTFLNLLKVGGRFCYVGVPEGDIVTDFDSIRRRISICGSVIGGAELTQKMLDFCAQHNIKSYVECLPMNEKNVNIALQKISNNEPRFRMVLTNEHNN